MKLISVLKPLFFICIVGAAIALASCKKTSYITDKSAKLSFNTDTLLFDTQFVSLGSATKHIKVYNPWSKAIKIDEIRLGRGKDSPYRINVDGEPAYVVKDYEMLPNDSIYIFVDVKIDPGNPDLLFIEKDSITFVSNGNLQQVKLMCWGRDAHFYHDSMLPCNTVWSNDKPYVISNHIGIAPGCKLSIQPGVEIYSDNSSGIFVWGSIEAKGTSTEPIVFRGLRLEQYYKDLPGQWYGIRFLPGSSNNYFENCLIRNATFGMEVDSLPPAGQKGLTLQNTRIENMSAVGLVGYTAQIDAYNLIIDNCCKYLMVTELGGSYTFYHSTFSHATCRCISSEPAIYHNNSDYNSISNPLELAYVNSIIWGSNDDELVIENTGKGSINIGMSNNLIKTQNDLFNANNNILNQLPKFHNVCNYKFELDTLSPAFSKGLELNQLPQQVQSDFYGVARKAKPDIGAIERIE